MSYRSSATLITNGKCLTVGAIAKFFEILIFISPTFKSSSGGGLSTNLFGSTIRSQSHIYMVLKLVAYEKYTSKTLSFLIT
jgi:hypothetical protein